MSIPIPPAVKIQAQLGLNLLKKGFLGGTPTGWNRAKQLTGQTIDIQSLADMRTWFARHGPDASNGGTSYPGYLKWVRNGKPMSSIDHLDQYRGAVAWLIWGGDPAYLWLKRPDIRKLLENKFPDRKIATPAINLVTKKI